MAECRDSKLWIPSQKKEGREEMKKAASERQDAFIPRSYVGHLSRAPSERIRNHAESITDATSSLCVRRGRRKTEKVEREGNGKEIASAETTKQEGEKRENDAMQLNAPYDSSRLLSTATRRAGV